MMVPPQKKLRAALLFFIVCITACSYVDPYGPNLNSANFFWISVDETKTRNEYSIVRISAVDWAGNQFAVATGPFDDKYKLIPPPYYGSEKLTYLVELRTRLQEGERISLIAKNAMARGYLSSRYVVKVGQQIPRPGDTEEIVLDVKDLKIGYSYGGLDISSIPSMPSFFDLHVDFSHEGIEPLLAKGYTPVLAVAMAKEDDGSDPGIIIDLSKYPPVSEKDVLGIASPDTGWFMLMEKTPYPKGADCRFWVFFMLNKEITTARVFYQDGKIPDPGGVLETALMPTYAGVPITDVSALGLMALSDNLRKGTPYENLNEMFVLTRRIYSFPSDAAPKPWLPIGRDSNIAHGDGYSPFTGVIEGAGYKIMWDNLQTLTATHPYSGLFGYAVNAKFYNMQLEFEEIDLTSSDILFDGSDIATGTLVGYARNCTFKDVTAEGMKLKVTKTGAGANYLKGLVGRKEGSSQSLGNVSSTVLSLQGTGGSAVITTEGY